MFGRLFLLLALIPIAELFVLVAVYRALAERFDWQTAFGVTVGAILVTGVAGALMARSQGVAAVQKLRATLARDEFPGPALLDAAMIVAGGALLILPGYLSDLLGLTLLIPPTRAGYRRLFERWLRGKIARGEAELRARMAVMDPDMQTAAPGWPPQRPGEVVIEETFQPPSEPERDPRDEPPGAGPLARP